MPGLLVAPVFSGAQVMTVTVSSLAPPVAPGMTPHPTASVAHAVSAPAVLAAVLAVVLAGWWCAERKMRVRRLPVMDTHDSVTSLTRA
jgi:hypothetical protein